MCTTEWFLIELDLSSRSYYAPPTASFQCLPHLGTEAHCPGSVKPQERGCDFKKAFDSIVRTKMLRILQAYGIPHQMVEAIKVMDENTSALVINRPVPHRHWSASRWSTGSVPIHNLSRLCPDNCHLTIWWNYIEKASKFKTPEGGSFWSRVCGWMRLLENVLKEAEDLPHRVEEASQYFGRLFLNAGKTKFMRLNPPSDDQMLSLDGSEIGKVDDFLSLGSYTETSHDIDTRIGKAWGSLNALSKVWLSPIISHSRVHPSPWVRLMVTDKISGEKALWHVYT